jgi:hypothetical protein
MSLSKAIAVSSFAAMLGMVGASLAEASCGTRAIVLRPGTRGEIVRTLLTQHREEVRQELVRSGMPSPTPVPCFACRENVPLSPVPAPVNPSASQRSQAVDALLLVFSTLSFDTTRSFLREQSNVLNTLLDSPPPTPPPIA